MPENQSEPNKINAQDVLAGILTGVRSHTRDGETATDFSGKEKIDALRELEKQEASKNPFAAIKKARVPLRSMQE